MDSYIELYNEGTLTLKSAAEHSGLSEEEFLRLLEEDSKNK
jgi:predicted HTH domain antitoxin